VTSRAARAAFDGRRKPQFNIGCHETETIEKGRADGFDAARALLSEICADVARVVRAHLQSAGGNKKARWKRAFLNAHAAQSNVDLKR
jgi:hypothetical protein